jgi:hypothetical protein
MANIGYYLDALTYFEEPATVAEVHAKAVELFKDNIKGDRTSCRLSLERYIGSGKVEKRGKKYLATQLAYDPISALTAKLRASQAEVDDLKSKNRKLLTELEATKGEVDQLKATLELQGGSA